MSVLGRWVITPLKSAFGIKATENPYKNHTQISIESMVAALAPQMSFYPQGAEIDLALHDLANIIESTTPNPDIDRSLSFREMAYALQEAPPGETTLHIPNDIWHSFERDVEALEEIENLLMHTIDRKTEINNASNVTVLSDVRGKKALQAWKESLPIMQASEMPAYTTDGTFYFPPDTVDTSNFPKHPEKTLDELRIDLEKIMIFRNEAPRLRARVMFDNQPHNSSPYDWSHEG